MTPDLCLIQMAADSGKPSPPMFSPRVVSLALLCCVACAGAPEADPPATQMWRLGTIENEPMDRDWIPESYFGSSRSKTVARPELGASECKKAFEHQYSMLAFALIENRGRERAADFLISECNAWRLNEPRAPLPQALKEIARRCRREIGLGSW